jgi:hypothetical protein
MDFTYIRPATCGVLLLFGATIAVAQEPANLGELLDKGAKRLDAPGVKALLAGATSKGLSYNGRTESVTTFSSDGKANTKVYGMHPEVNPNLFGTWTVNDKGQGCVDLMPSDPRLSPFKGCNWWYSLNDVYFIAASEDRGTVVRSRKIQR